MSVDDLFALMESWLAAVELQGDHLGSVNTFNM